MRVSGHGPSFQAEGGPGADPLSVVVVEDRFFDERSWQERQS